MIPLFIFSPPRHRGDLLVRMLNASPGVRCAGDSHDFLQRLRRLHGHRNYQLKRHPGDFPEEGNEKLFQRNLNLSSRRGWDEGIRQMLPLVCEPGDGDTVYGMRDIHTLTGDWEKDAAFLSWLQWLEPTAKLLFLKRDQAEFEISLAMTHWLWVPSYAKCESRVLSRVQGVWETFDRYHRLNPESTAVVDSAELLDVDAITGRLGRWGIELSREAWGAEIQRAPGNKKEEQLRKPVVKEPEVGAFDRLPLPAVVDRKDIDVFTLKFGDPPWMEECHQSLRGWCDRHGLELTTWTKVDPDLPSEKFAVVEMLRAFLKGDKEWMIYVDADVLVHPLAPLPDLTQPGMHIRQDLLDDTRWLQWTWKHFNVRPHLWTYRNAGVWMCDRAAAEAVLAQVQRPYLPGVMEQHQWNYWLWRAKEAGMPVVDMPGEWNAFAELLRVGWFYHLAGPEKMEKLKALKDTGLMPTTPEESVSLAEPAAKRAIVYPWSSRKAVWEELKYSLRSVEKYFEDKECPIFLLVDRPPAFLKSSERVHVISAPRYEEALEIGVQLADEILWMNDDLYFRAPCGWDDLRPGQYFPGNKVPWAKSKVPCNTQWRRGLRRVVRDLHHHGVDEVLSFSTHMPYVYERGRAVEVLKRFGKFFKMPFETAYFNWHRDLPRRRFSSEMRQVVANHQGEIHQDAQRVLMADLTSAAEWEI
jgi:hypothetical protein